MGMNGTSYFWGNASWRRDRHLCPNEVIHWYAMRYWKSRNMHWYDLGGGGDYKRKYGGQEHNKYAFRKSRYIGMDVARNLAMRAFRLGQKLQGWHKRERLDAASAASCRLSLHEERSAEE